MASFVKGHSFTLKNTALGCGRKQMFSFGCFVTIYTAKHLVNEISFPLRNGMCGALLIARKFQICSNNSCTKLYMFFSHGIFTYFVK